MALISLTRGLSAIVDAADFDWLNQWKWHASGPHGHTFYAARRDVEAPGRPIVYMHRLIHGISARHVDHINRDGLDNRRENLRAASVSQNQANSRQRPSRQPYRGVERLPNGNYRARLKRPGQSQHLGVFADAESAARARDAAAQAAFGEFAVLNFPA